MAHAYVHRESMDMEDIPLNSSGIMLPPPYASINAQASHYSLQAVPGTPYFMIVSPQPTTSYYEGAFCGSLPTRPASPPPSHAPLNKAPEDFDPSCTEEALAKMRPLTVTFSVLQLVACLVAFILAVIMVCVHGSRGLLVANASLFASPIIFIFNIMQLIYAIHGPKSLRRAVPYGAFVLFVIAVIGFIISVILAVDDMLTLWLSMLTMGLMAAIQLAYAVCAFKQAKLLFRAEINESYRMAPHPTISV